METKDEFNNSFRFLLEKIKKSIKNSFDESLKNLSKIKSVEIEDNSKLFMIAHMIGRIYARLQSRSGAKAFSEFDYYLDIDFLKMKVPMTKEKWKTIEQSLKDYFFTVAGQTKEEIIEAIKQKLISVKESGGGFKDFEKEIQSLNLEKAVHPLVYWQNVGNCQEAGRYAQMMDDIDIAPYWQYLAEMDDSTRPSHAAMNMKVFRYDDPIWDIWYPKNGFGCRCMVRSLSPEYLERKKYQVEKGSAFKDLKPDKGFEGNVGKSLDYWKKNKNQKIEKNTDSLKMKNKDIEKASEIQKNFEENL
ncbi:MAG TPA: hypothetical protein DHW82_00385 [Spirochaetia bacterium]|nr:MAG: hypothetical protein A2Y41_07250 [Spirochaetes bacterium GWB1_36_13]HCL55456.1 hypothetical protein [Spirochaetia bacterium]